MALPLPSPSVSGMALSQATRFYCRGSWQPRIVQQNMHGQFERQPEHWPTSPESIHHFAAVGGSIRRPAWICDHGECSLSPHWQRA